MESRFEKRLQNQAVSIGKRTIESRHIANKKDIILIKKKCDCIAVLSGIAKCVCDRMGKYIGENLKCLLVLCILYL